MVGTTGCDSALSSITPAIPDIPWGQSSKYHSSGCGAEKMTDAVAASATLPVLLTEAALRETNGHEPVETLLDMTVELRPIGAMEGGVSEHGSSHSIARSAYNLRLRGENESALRLDAHDMCIIHRCSRCSQCAWWKVGEQACSWSFGNLLAVVGE
jgi:hypothetical protein